jgi:single-strand DNA-binding protein
MEGTTYPRMNRVFLTGIAQEEPELRYTPSGVSVCSFRLQVGRILRDRSGGAREVAAYLTVVAWQEAAQRMSRELRKGQAVYVEGYVSSRSFTTARGDKRTAIEIYAEQIQILGPFREGEKADQGGGDQEDEHSGGQGPQRRTGYRRHEGPRPEAAREQSAESSRERQADPAGDSSSGSSQEAVEESKEPAKESKEPAAESPATEESSGSTGSEGGSQASTAPEGGEEKDPDRDTQNP